MFLPTTWVLEELCDNIALIHKSEVVLKETFITSKR